MLVCHSGDVMSSSVDVCNVVQLLPSEAQHGYLLKLTELLNIDNSRNWRFREELARCVDFSDMYYLM